MSNGTFWRTDRKLQSITVHLGVKVQKLHKNRGFQTPIGNGRTLLMHSKNLTQTFRLPPTFFSSMPNYHCFALKSNFTENLYVEQCSLWAKTIPTLNSNCFKQDHSDSTTWLPHRFTTGQTIKSKWMNQGFFRNSILLSPDSRILICPRFLTALWIKLLTQHQ